MKQVNNVLQGVAMVIVLGISSTALAAPEPFVGEIMVFGG
jgi:hypothetical protein